MDYGANDVIDTKRASSSFKIDPQSEGINSIRLALLRSVSNQAPKRQPDGGNTQLANEFREMLEETGLNPDLIRFLEPIPTVEQSLSEASAILELNLSTSSTDETRDDVFELINKSKTPRYRLAGLASGMSSPLERESTVAAVAMLNSTQPRQSLPSWTGVLFATLIAK